MKKVILNKAVEDFMTYGYENTTMRQIASELNVAVGNVNYYYPKKEDIVIDYHNAVMNAFVDEVLKNSSGEDPWITYFAAEYSFMYYIAFDDPTRSVYKSFTNVASLREFYINKHQELFLSIFNDTLNIDKDDIYLSTLAMCSLEFELISKIDEHNEWDYDDIITHIFETRLSFLHLRISVYKDRILKAIQKGKNYDSIHETIHASLKEKL